jgi:hypothetical protein
MRGEGLARKGDDQQADGVSDRGESDRRTQGPHRSHGTSEGKIDPGAAQPEDAQLKW